MITALEAVLGLAELYAFDSSSLHPGQHIFHLHPDHHQHVPTQHVTPYSWLVMWCTGRLRDWGNEWSNLVRLQYIICSRHALSRQRLFSVVKGMYADALMHARHRAQVTAWAHPVKDCFSRARGLTEAMSHQINSVIYSSPPHSCAHTAWS